MAFEVQCPSCQTILRPSAAMLRGGGQHPCPTCHTLLHIDPNSFRDTPPAPPMPPSRRPRRRPFRVPLWVWPVAAFLLVFVLGGGGMAGYWLLKPGGRPLFG